MSSATLLKLAAAFNQPNQTAIIDSLTKDSGILRTMPFQKASHGLFHKYKIKTGLPSGGFRNVNGSIIPHTTNDEVKQTDLKILTDIQQEDKAICESYPGGVEKYFADELPAFVEGLGQTAAKQVIYGTDGTFGDSEGFVGLRQSAIANSNIIAAGGTSGSRTTILAVRWKHGICTGLFNENAFADGQMITVRPLNTGNPVMVVVDTATGAVKPVYQALYEAYMGLLVADTKNVAAYTQIQDASGKKPTAANLDKLIDMVNGTAGDTFIYCNRIGRRLLWELKDSKMQITPAETEYNSMLERWNGIPMILDENLSATETI
ncbi:MAG: hypothetical protein K8S56_02420 [Candidatus Cloacimonetes bacterium]|nr:hypothetical protein [Candidatus Cloacimonadota bacterium]